MNRFNRMKIGLLKFSVGVSGLVILKYAYSRHTFRYVLASEETTDGNSNHTRSDDLTLRTVQIFFRHGARTPISHLPNVEEVNYDRQFIMARVPYTEVPYEVYNLHDGSSRPRALLDERYRKTQFKGGCFGGALTALGRDQTYELGRNLKSKYFKELKLKGTFDPLEIYVRSTNINRTIESLQGVLAGMFGVKNFSEPVKIPVTPIPSEFLYPQVRNCVPFSVIYQNTLKKEAETNSIKNLTDKINNIIGHDGYLDMIAWRDNLVARKAHGLPIPKLISNLEEEIEETAVDIISNHVAGPQSCRHIALKYAIGPVLEMISGNIKAAAIANKSTPKMYLYSCHDTSLVPILIALKMFDKKWPTYCAYIAIELWQRRDGENLVKISYCNKDMIPEGMSNPLMTVHEFEKLITPYRMSLEKWYSECQYSQGKAFNESVQRSPKDDGSITSKAM